MFVARITIYLLERRYPSTIYKNRPVLYMTIANKGLHFVAHEIPT